MDKYINGGLIKSFTITYFNETEIKAIYDDLWLKIDLNMFDLRRIDNLLIFNLKDEYLLKIDSFFEELKDNNMLIDEELREEVVIRNYDKNDFNIFHNDLYDIEIEYYLFFYQGPYDSTDNIIFLLNYLHNATLKASSNVLSRAICFGIN